MNQHDLFDPSDSSAVKFQQYHQQNPQVYEKFAEFTFDAIRAGRKYFGAKMIIERIRWYSLVEANDGYKVNNNYAPYYARMFEAKHPQYTGFFRKRRLTA